MPLHTVSLTYGLDITTIVRLPDLFSRPPINWTWVKPWSSAPITLPVIIVRVCDFGCVPDLGRYLELSYSVTEGRFPELLKEGGGNGLINDTRPSV